MPLCETKKQKQREAKALLEGFWGQAFKFNQPTPLLSFMFNAISIKKRSEKALSVSG
ncbi:hypothetical protein [Rosenbergiella epipactidis]|uniref:hypothetical protein n=1 Tax=Rosenbergiella epipactidis TaxID=1544694 RepID=UPI001F4E6E42|nr:hypothetical protein [Rosenbergiella epipactidis]